MSRFFAVPVLATMLALVGIRMLGTWTPRADEPLTIVVAPEFAEASAGRPEPTPAPIVTAEDLWAPAPTLPSPPPVPRVEPPVVVPEPLPPPAPEVRTEVVERTVIVPQQTIIYAPTTIYYPAPEATTTPPQEVVESPVIVVTNAPYGRPLPPARRPKAQPESSFKEIPFLPPTPKGPRWSP